MPMLGSSRGNNPNWKASVLHTKSRLFVSKLSCNGRTQLLLLGKDWAWIRIRWPQRRVNSDEALI